MKQMVYALALLIMMAWGCENIAVLPRKDISDDLKRRGGERDRVARERTDRDRDIRESTLPRNEIVGTVQRIDESRREIQLRTTEGQTVRIKYDDNTAVFNRDRELRVASLNYGDQILVRLDSNSSGERYANVIRMNDSQDIIR
ncbi:MAG: hypothetical protein ACREQ7_17675 [Candidatus Binatia bacterium]